jgi:hypothetical protein
MDTHWFAVDKEGHVALFFTAETGFMPRSCTAAEGYDLIQMYRTITGKTPPGIEDEDENVSEWDEFLEAFGAQGFFYYNYIDADDPEGLVIPYTLWGVPEPPLHVDELPPQVRQQCARCCLESAVFGSEEYLQPIELTSGYWQCWSDDECAFLTTDKSSVRPIPGREAKYSEFQQTGAKELKSRRKGVRIEGIDQPPKK